ncbi:MAG: H-NS histone family protein [Motiliproteus sp.]|nr:H-NS histone family protein [Motiliproteus sp.]
MSIQKPMDWLSCFISDPLRIMSAVLKNFVEKPQLASVCSDLSLKELEAVYANLTELLEERRQSSQDNELRRKGDRVLDDMRGLMAKAGISMTDLQKALG